MAICFKANQKLSVLGRLAGLSTFDRKRILLKAGFESQFKYCPLIRMFCSRWPNNKISKLYERVLRLIYDDYETSFLDLLATVNLLPDMQIFKRSYLKFLK